MRKIFLTKKTGFINVGNKPIIIRDYRGIKFYDTSGLSPQPEKFNMPQGEYYLDQGHIRETEPVNYPLVKLPPFERNLKKPYNFKIIFGDNPNKCTIYWRKKIILFDNDLKDYSLPELDFIRFHEFGHARFKTEKYADLMAVNYMLTKGYNPLQIGEAQLTSLSDNNYERKVFLTNKIVSYENKRKRSLTS